MIKFPKPLLCDIWEPGGGPVPAADKPPIQDRITVLEKLAKDLSENTGTGFLVRLNPANEQPSEVALKGFESFDITRSGLGLSFFGLVVHQSAFNSENGAFEVMIGDEYDPRQLTVLSLKNQQPKLWSENFEQAFALPFQWMLKTALMGSKQYTFWNGVCETPLEAKQQKNGWRILYRPAVAAQPSRHW